MSDDLIKRLREADSYNKKYYALDPLHNEAADCIEQLEREKAELSASLDENWVTHQEVLFSKRYAAKAEAKLAKAVEALRKIAAYTHSGPYDQSITQHAEARIARTALAELGEMK